MFTEITPTSPTQLRSKAAERLGANVSPEHRMSVRTRMPGVSSIAKTKPRSNGRSACAGAVIPARTPVRADRSRSVKSGNLSHWSPSVNFPGTSVSGVFFRNTGETGCRASFPSLSASAARRMPIPAVTVSLCVFMTKDITRHIAGGK